MRVHQEEKEEEGLAPMGREPLRRVPSRLFPRHRDRGELVGRREEGREALCEAVAGVERRVGDEGRRGPTRPAQVRRDRGHAGDDTERRAVGAFLDSRDASGQKRGDRRNRPGGRGVGAVGLPGAAEDRVEVGARRVGAAIEPECIASRRVEEQKKDRIRSRVGPHDTQIGKEKRPGGIQPQPQSRSGARSGNLPILVEEDGRAGSLREPPRRAPDGSRRTAAGRQQLRDERNVSSPCRRRPGEAQASAGVLRQRPLECIRDSDSLVPDPLGVHDDLRGTGGWSRPDGRFESAPTSGKCQQNGEENRAPPARVTHRSSLMQPSIIPPG